jgi:two-component system, response regulator
MKCPRGPYISTRLVNPVVWCKSGQEALDYLRNEGLHEGAQQNRRPGLILLDLNMPGIDGHEVLRSVKEDDSLKQIPVIILTTSGSEHDVTRSFQAGANSYVQKPVTFDRLIEALNGLKEYWLEISLLPRDKD